MPLRHDVRSVTVPGCVDGWMLLHERLGSLPFGEIVVPAIRLAAAGAPASPLLCASLALLDDDAAPRFVELAEQASEPGAIVRRPGVALTLQAIVRGGRDAFYGGAFGEGLLELGDGVFDADDLDRIQAALGAGAHRAGVRPRAAHGRADRRRATSPWPSPGSSNGSGCPTRRTTSSGPTCSSRP